TLDGQGSKSRTISTQDKNLAPSDVVRRIKPNEGVLVYGALLPARLKLRPWYKSKRLTAMVRNTAPLDSPKNNQDGPSDGTSDIGTDGDSRGAYEDYLRSSPVG